MHRFLVCLALLVPALSIVAQDYVPRDVQRFIDRREGCDHMRGESDSLKELSRDIRKLCGGTDKELAQLKLKYAANSTIMQILNQFETGIEAAEAEVPMPKSGTPKRKS